jgi:hypothetical protein
VSRIAPTAPPAEQLRLARALGLKPLRVRDRPVPAAPARLRIAATATLESLMHDAMLLAVLRAIDVGVHEIGTEAAGDGPLLSLGRDVPRADATLPDLVSLRGNAAAKRAAWPALRRLRRKLLDA